MNNDKSIKGFKFLTGDTNYLDYGGKWYRQINDRCYHVINLVNMWDATGEENQPKYNIQLEEINLDEISQKNIDSAISCCGFDDEQIEEVESGKNDLWLIESISTYGCFAHMGNWDGNNFKKLFNLASEESYNLNNERYHESRMNRPVNKIGSTAREMMQGDFTSGLIRSIASGDKSARILGKIQGLSSDDLDLIEGDKDLKNFNLN